jgi:hypothetical protein
MTRLITIWKHSCRITGVKEQSLPRSSDALRGCDLFCLTDSPVFHIFNPTQHEVLSTNVSYSFAYGDSKIIILFRSCGARSRPGLALGGATEVVQVGTTIGQAAALSSDRPFTYGGYHFAVLESDEINDLSCPGGIIFITRGMVQRARNE